MSVLKSQFLNVLMKRNKLYYRVICVNYTILTINKYYKINIRNYVLVINTTDGQTQRRCLAFYTFARKPMTIRSFKFIAKINCHSKIIYAQVAHVYNDIRVQPLKGFGLDISFPKAV